jgi:hypothetical protein
MIMRTYTQEEVQKFIDNCPCLADNASGKFEGIDVISTYDFIDNLGNDKIGLKLKLTNNFRADRAEDLLAKDDVVNALNFNMTADFFADYKGYVPTKGDTVTVKIKQIPIKDGNGTFPKIVGFIEEKAQSVSMRRKKSAPIEAEKEETLDEVLKKK